MFKRLIPLMLCLALLCCSVAQAADYDDLFEKAYRQISLGSGLRGSVSFEATGTADWLDLFRTMTGQDVQVRYIRSGTHAQLLLYIEGENEEQHGLTQIDEQPTVYTLTTDLLPDATYTLANPGDLFSLLFDRDDSVNPVFYQAAYQLLQEGETLSGETWFNALEPLYTEIDAWLNSFAAAPTVEKDGDTSTLRIAYEIPADSVKKELVVLLRMALANTELVQLVSAEMKDEEVAAYLNPNLMYYYEALIESMELEGSVKMERRLTTLGEEVSSRIEFPVNWNGFTTFTMIRGENEPDQISLSGPDRTVEYESRDSGCILRIKQAQPTDENPSIAAVLDWKKDYETYQDASSTREHEITTWSLNITSEEGASGVLAFDPIELQVTTHLHSKNANSSPTTILVDASLKANAADLTVHAELKTSNNWILRGVPAATVQLDELTQDGVDELVAQAKTALEQLVATLKAVPETVATEAVATETDATATDID